MMSKSQKGKLDPSLSMKTERSSVSVKASLTDGKEKKLAAPAIAKKVNEPISKGGKNDVQSEQEDMEFELTIAVLERDEGDLYGCGSCTPPFLQFCRRQPAALLSVLCILEIATAYVQHGAIPAAFSQLQLRFQFTTYDLAKFRNAYDIGSLLMLIPVTIFAEHDVHRAQWIGVGALVTGIGSTILTLPHFLVEDSRTQQTGGDYCGGSQSRPCDSRSEYTYVFLLGELLIGMGQVPQYIMGITFLDENITHRQSTFYTAIFSMCQLIGPVISFFVTGQVMNIPGDIDKYGFMGKRYGSSDQNWYGAWWISVLIGAMLSWIGAALIFPFPRQLSGAAVAHIRDSREAMMEAHSEYEDQTEIRFAKRIKNILTNRTFLFSTLEQCCRSFLVSGLVIFLPKYLEAMFDVSASVASQFVGSTIVFAALIALGFGYVVQDVLHLDVVGNLRFCLLGAIGTVIFSGVLAVKCSTAEVVGVTKLYPHPYNSSVNLTNECNEMCSCQTEKFEPVCYRNTSHTFFSKCYAGCDEDGNDCRCASNGTVLVGPCNRCSSYRLYAFLLGFSWVGMSMYVRLNPMQQVLLRAVHFNVRATALALSAVLQRSIASLPAPFVFAKILRAACKLFLKHCQYEQTCGYFDKERMSLAMIVTAVVMSTFSVIALFFALVWYKDPHAVEQKSQGKSVKAEEKPKEKKNLTSAKATSTNLAKGKK